MRIPTLDAAAAELAVDDDELDYFFFFFSIFTFPPQHKFPLWANYASTNETYEQLKWVNTEVARKSAKIIIKEAFFVWSDCATKQKNLANNQICYLRSIKLDSALLQHRPTNLLANGANVK